MARPLRLKFSGIPKKWLKDRRERSLDVGEIQSYCRVVTALGRTIALQRDINALYPLV